MALQAINETCVLDSVPSAFLIVPHVGYNLLRELRFADLPESRFVGVYSDSSSGGSGGNVGLAGVR